MKPPFLFLLLLVLLPVSSALQDLLPGIPPHGERIQILPIVFCLGALALPTMPALFLSLAAAVVQGLALLQVQSGQAELGLTLPVVFFLGWGLLLRMAGEATLGMRWELHAAGSFLVTLTMLAGEFLILCVKRGGFPVDGPVLMKIFVPAVASLLLSPPAYLLLRPLTAPPAAEPGELHAD